MNPAAAELLAKLIVLVAALLPVAAVAIRMIGFLLDPHLRNVLQLAVALPIVDLTALGAWELFFPVLSLLFTAALAREIARDRGRLRRVLHEGAEFVAEYESLGADLDTLRTRLDKPEHDPEAPESAVPEDFAADLANLQHQHERLQARYDAWTTERDRGEPGWVRFMDRLFGPLDPLVKPIVAATSRLSRRTRIIASVLGLAILAAWLPAFPMLMIAIPTGLGGQVLIFRAIDAAGDFRLRHAWPGVAVFMIGYVLASGLTYSGPRPAIYYFNSATGVDDGSYAELGRTDDLLYLRPCADPTVGSIAVPASAVRLIKLPPPTARPLQPSLLDVLQGNQTLRLGTAGQCDNP